MENQTTPPYFYLTMFKDLGYLSFVYFGVALITYGSTVLLNVVILLVILRESELHQPMYIFISCLSINGLYGTNALFPRLLRDLLSARPAVSYSACILQAFAMFTYASCEFTILTVMAHDRYVAICRPLRYHSIMTAKAVALMVAMAWLYPALTISMGTVAAVRLPLSTGAVVRLSCVSTAANNAYGIFIAVTTVFVPFTYILFTYVKILVICRKRSTEFKRKAFYTCVPHIVSFVTYSIAIFCEITFSRYEGELPGIVAVVLSLEFVVIPPVLNPVIYGRLVNAEDVKCKCHEYCTQHHQYACN
uniref:G-protein coupled receptors family 1 profile domain-containing protein n=1 Tax=Denticeps clupeoides TaxID=299321 RepID=A0AAY4A742_9TELE